MARSTPLKTIIMGLMLVGTLALAGACEEEATECTTDLACANQEGLVQTCCTELGEDNWSCTYVTPDGTEFACAPITDEVNAGDYCEEAVEALTAHCSVQ